MAVKYFHPAWIPLILVAGAAAVAAAVLLRARSSRRGLRVANTERLRALPIYKRKRLESLACRSVLAAGLVAGLVACAFLTARPWRKEPVTDDVTRRDIFLCMDISASSCPGLSGFVEEFGRQVAALEGDQVGISLFNTSSMQYVPVTEDYDFIAQRLEELEGYFQAAEAFERDFASKYAHADEIPEGERARYEALNATLSAFDRGTTAGYELKGTSAIGEGLASCLFSFPELYSQGRSRSIIFVTDNLPEYLEEPLVTLEEAAQMCAEDGVTVYGVYPAVGAAGTREAMAALRSAAERTGGAFYALDGDGDAGQVLAAIQAREREASKALVSSQDADVPQGWTAALLAGLGLAFAALVYQVASTGARILKALPRRRLAASALMLLAAAACAALIAIRPMRMDEDDQVRTGNLDVCFAVDSTISMWAEDYGGGEPRIAGVRSDIRAIMEALPGSSFSLVSFDNGSQILAPYIQNVAALDDCVERLSLPSYATAEGSSLNTAHDALAAMIRASGRKAGERKAILFVMSDGEITDGSQLMRFDDLEAGVDDGAVLGYGTAEGGRMDYPGKGYLQDSTRGEDARSAIDEENLRSLAQDLGLRYVHRQGEGDGELASVLARIRRLSRTAALRSGDRRGWSDTYYWFSGILALILMGYLFRLFNRGNVL